MTFVGNSVIKELSGAVDGSNKEFTTPSNYSPGTFRIIINGQVYESDDDEYGWSEIDTLTIETVEAPQIGDVLQGFYQDTGENPAALSNVIGTPFDPDGNLP